MDITVTKISDNEIIEVFSNLQLLQNTLLSVLQSRVVYPRFRIRIFHSGFRVKKIPDPGSGSA
jgi:hypothetical protein